MTTDKWVVRWPGHPEVTFEDLKNGRLPKLSAEERAQLKRAILEAREIRQSLDIRPLTTADLIRQVREGS